MINLAGNRFNPKTLLKVLFFWIVFLLVYMAFAASFYLLIPVGPEMDGMRHGIAGTIWSLTITWLFLKREKKSFRDIGLVWEKKTLGRFVAGLLLGTAIFAVMILGLLACTDLGIFPTGAHPGSRVMLSLLALLPLAFMEEVAFRSMPLIYLEKAYGLRIAQLVIAIAFALYHVANGWGLLAAFGGTFIWSYVFGLSARWSAGISMATGVHIAINLAQSLLDMKNKGRMAWRLSFRETPSAAQLARAENTGLVLQLLILVITIVVMEWYVRRKVDKKPSLL